MLEDFSIAGGTVGMLLLGLLVLTFAIIFFYKGYVKKQSEEDLRSKYQDGTIGSYLKSRNKYPEVDVLRKTSPIFGYGLAASLALTLFAFSWTKFEKPVIIPDDALDYEEEIEVEPPRTAEPPPPPPPPPPPAPAGASLVCLMDSEILRLSGSTLSTLTVTTSSFWTTSATLATRR